MTRANLMIVVILTLGLAGMFFWTLSLSNQQSRLLSQASEGGPAGTVNDQERRIRALEQNDRAQNLALDSLDADRQKTVRRLDELDTKVSDQGKELAALSVAGVSAGDAGKRGEVLTAAIEDVLDRRAEEARKQQVDRMARGMSRYLLGDVTATDQQKEQFVTVIKSYLSGREKVRAEYSGDNPDTQARDEAVKRLEEDRDQQLSRIFGATDLQKIQERLNRGRGFFGGRGGGRTGRTRGAGGGGNR